MTQKDEPIKSFTVRWPESFWDKAKRAAHDKRTSLQKAATLGCAAYLDIDPPSVDDEEVEDQKKTA